MLPCGCDALAEARKTDGEGNREQAIAVARQYQQQWGCPVASGKGFPRNTDHIPKHGRRVLARVEALTGATGLATCPCAYTRRADLLPALQWRNRRDKGWLLQTHGNKPLPALLVAQIEAVDAGQNARSMHELEAMRKSAKAPA